MSGEPARRRIPWQPGGGPSYAIRHLDLDPARTALLVVDLQVAHVDPDHAVGCELRRRYPDLDAYYHGRIEATVLPAVESLLASFRERGRRVVFSRSVVAGPDGQDLAPWSWRAVQRREGRCLVPALLPRDAPGSELPARLGRRQDELLLDKITLSPFNGTALDGFLRNMSVENLVIAGVLTNGAVETTARGAADRGYHCIVVEDACAALTPEDHRYGTRFPTWYVVRTLAEVLRDLG